MVCYWIEKAGRQIALGKTARAGLVSTNSIRGGANRRALQAATATRRIFEAWSDEPWVIDGAAVRVSLVCFSRDDESVFGAQLDGQPVDEIYADLTARRGGVRICPDHQLIVIVRADDTTFGILHSRFHELWSLRLCTWLGKGNDPRYTPSTTFETFPFPAGLTANMPVPDYAVNPRATAIADAARRLVEQRDRWLNPAEWVECVDEPVPGYPKRPVPRDEDAAKALRKRTLTNLYNDRPQWLADAHATVRAARRRRRSARRRGWIAVRLTGRIGGTELPSSSASLLETADVARGGPRRDTEGLADVLELIGALGESVW